MKSQQSEDNKFTMDCEGCIFAEIEDDYQYGCAAGRISKFAEDGDIVAVDGEKTSFFGLKRFCNLYRDDEWLENNIEGNAGVDDKPVQEALTESEPVFGIVVYDVSCDGKNDLDKTIESIKNINYNKKKIQVVLSSRPLNSGKIQVSDLVHKCNQINEIGIECHLVLNRTQEIPKRDYDAFSKFSSVSHLIKSTSCDAIPEYMLKEIHTSLNIDMEKNLVFQHGSISCISFPVVNNEYLKYNDFELMVESIKNMAIQAGMIKSL